MDRLILSACSLCLLRSVPGSILKGHHAYIIERSETHGP